MHEDTVELAIGDEVRGLDGFRGELSRVVVDSAGRQLTHLVVAPRHEGGFRRLVPVEMLEAAEAGLRMGCSRAEFEALPRAEEAKFVTTPSGDAADAAETAGGITTGSVAVVVGGGDRVPVADGDVGRFKGLIVRAADGGITHVIVNAGLPWTSNSRTVPVSGEPS